MENEVRETGEIQNDITKETGEVESNITDETDEARKDTANETGNEISEIEKEDAAVSEEGKSEPGKKKGFFSRMSRPKKVLFVIAVVIVVLLAAVGITFLVMRGMGEASLKVGSKGNTESEDYKKVTYEGKEYVYNDKLINILIMGVDMKKKITTVRKNIDTEDVQSKIFGGQADALFIMTIDTENRKVSLMPINRYSITDIQVYEPEEGAYTADRDQICLQHAYGTGLEDSCELQVQAVSGMLYNIKINGYVSVNLPAIKTMNKLVGGIKLKILENIPGKATNGTDYGIGDSLANAKGKTLTLTNKQAYAYIRYRDTNKEGSSDKRLKRIKQYMKAYAKKAVKKTKSDITFPFKLMAGLSDYMVTDIDTPEMVYLISTVPGYDLDMDNMEGLPGKLYRMDEAYMGYELDQTALKEMIIKNFYKAVG